MSTSAPTRVSRGRLTEAFVLTPQTYLYQATEASCSPLVLKLLTCRTSNWPTMYGNIKFQGDIHPPQYHFHEEKQSAHEGMTMGYVLLFGLLEGAMTMDRIILSSNTVFSFKRREVQFDGI